MTKSFAFAGAAEGAWGDVKIAASKSVGTALDVNALAKCGAQYPKHAGSR